MPLNLFLREHEKRNVSEWTYHVEDKSVSSKMLYPFWKKVASIVPKTVAPNVLSLAGFICILHAYYVVTVLNSSYPAVASLLAAVLVFAYQTLDAIDGIHARRTMNESSIGELFDHACDNVGMPFLVITVARCLGYTNNVCIWFVVQSVQLVLMKSHFKAFIDSERFVRYRVVGSPGDALIIVEIVLIARSMLGLDWLFTMYLHLLHLLSDLTEYILHQIGFTEFHAPHEQVTEEQLWLWGPKVIYYGLLLWFIARVLLTKKQLKFNDPITGEAIGEQVDTYPTKTALLLCLGYRAIPSLLLWVPGATPVTLFVSELDIICDGVLMSILTSDLILSKMARRNVHSWVPILYMLSIFDRLVCLVLVAVYFGGVFGDLCTYMNLPLLTTNVNVYCDGVYDLCHCGHKNLFKAALRFGTRLLVGVVGDEDANKYKRPPIMTCDERAAEVAGCKGVHTVIKDSPCFGLTEEFIKKHMIHVVAHGKEYTALDQAEEYRKEMEKALEKGDLEGAKELRKKAAFEQKKGDINPKALSERGEKYYKVAFDMGISEILPRTPGLSTSDLIRRCQEAGTKRHDK
ncbi:hypothetical protein SARC_03319 [Sphaeroforma arctica JP610]|uniref:Cytidyltransferase-like domain-containing protein n=1 Tax=Sphaeroforma arctica JP610 TaxID=667725 RepID=A0A0L0G600_9EUKA|nr:hypothetical protein SARC_03319 [Sphaeroforma arctica JP610]KNC84455.1 hypothetical protein SARC_03319 [Sphaeroforma arctica JP610]|eukprot:XP_014158357.1 hypothetical protein SARC_03319 [Sphaeroforma arctica JP610]